VSWIVEPAKTSEPAVLATLLRQTRQHGFTPRMIAGDKAYSGAPQHEVCRQYRIIPLFNLPRLPGGKERPDPTPTCAHGPMIWKGCETTSGRWRAKWVCSADECPTPTRWIEGTRADSLIPRGSERWKKLYAKRQAVERVFARLKHHYGLMPLHTRRLDCVRLHADLAVVAQLGQRLAQERARAGTTRAAA
jgi:hypothetical protein